ETRAPEVAPGDLARDGVAGAVGRAGRRVVGVALRETAADQVLALPAYAGAQRETLADLPGVLREPVEVLLGGVGLRPEVGARHAVELAEDGIGRNADAGARTRHRAV